MKHAKARLDTDGKSKPRTCLRGIEISLPGIYGIDRKGKLYDDIIVTELEDVETGERITLGNMRK